ncbi:MAG: hypothetical protein JKY37_32820 [Nannocystaceae bacterium]|nr:hypothetical protein [Nannocystaceae bacterium]
MSRAARIVVVATAGLCASPTVASAEPIEFVEQRQQYMIFEDVSGELENGNWFSRDAFLAAYGDVEGGFLSEHADDSQFLIIYTTWSLPGGIGALYQSVANDVHGIGYEHIAPLDAIIPEPYFDDTPNSQVQGFMHMNDWTFYLGEDPGGVDDGRISLVFGQELGHAWLAFVHWMDGGGTRSDMLGRSEAHWSFYLNSGGSPVEGHDWVDNGDGTFTAIKHQIFTFSDLDLYLMGLKPADEVAPWFILENPFNCVNSSLKDGACAPPQGHQFAARSYTVNASRRDISIEDVIAAEGPRVPAFGDAPTVFDASFLLITRPGERLSEGEKAQVDTIIGRSIEIWDEQTQGLGRVVNRTATQDGGDDGPSDDDGDGDGDGDGSTAPADGDSGEGDAGEAGEGGGPDGGDADGGLDGATGGGVDGGTAGSNDDGGCGCRSRGRTAPWWMLVLPAAWRRRRPTLRK